MYHREHDRHFAHATSKKLVVNAKSDGTRKRNMHSRVEPKIAQHTNTSGELVNTHSARPQGANTEPSLHRSNGQSRMDQLANAAVFSRLAPPTQDGKKLLVERQSSHRQLNPLFASWLMGWPSTWVIAAPHASNALATASWRSALQRHLSCLLSDQEFSS